MNQIAPSRLTDALFFFYALFIFGSTFSIALAQMALGVSLALFITVIVVHRYQPFVDSLKRFYVFVALYIIWIFVCSMLGETVGRSLYIMKEDWLFLIVPIGVFLMQNKTYRERLMAIFAVGVLLVSIYGLLQYSLGLNWFKDSALTAADGFGYRVRGNFSHRLTFGNYYATAALMLFGLGVRKVENLRAGRRQLFLAASLLAMAVTLLSFSRGSVIALVVGLLVAGVVLGRKYLISMIGGLAAMALVVALLLPGLVERFTGAMDKELSLEYEGSRPFIWQKSLSIAREHPVFGVGPGNFETEYAARLRPDIPDYRKHVHAHNDLINMVAVYGLPGFLLFAGLWMVLFGYTFGGFRRRRSFAEGDRFFLAASLGAVAFFTTALFEATFADEEVRQLLMFVWAVGLWPWYNEQRKAKRSAAKRS
ncbi:MAG: O-antigen ligase family protein [candidate division Zixibacteria bacterium]|nr:O-antigen ligase family protein [candidate division Zixibacteria bacterium]MDH3937609.1 O-antigen ligase family protein [candidate division Zixibacteria bacterium]MDH4032314.1 O-antigen ligase family protein [candidate division Zixibacteria bacterium]